LRLCGHIKNVGKQALQQSGKYPVNENDEEKCQGISAAFNYVSSFPDVQVHIVDAPLGAGPESIVPMVLMDSGFARFARAPE
jgi:hypothetical protein